MFKTVLTYFTQAYAHLNYDLIGLLSRDLTDLTSTALLCCHGYHGALGTSAAVMRL